jgi:hypothetical protein
MSSFDQHNIDAIIEAGHRQTVTDWSDQAQRLRDSLDRLEARMGDPEVSAAELATLAREKRIGLAELVGLGEGKKVGRVTRMQDAVSAQRLKLIQGDG